MNFGNHCQDVLDFYIFRIPKNEFHTKCSAFVVEAQTTKFQLVLTGSITTISAFQSVVSVFHKIEIKNDGQVAMNSTPSDSEKP